MPNPSPRTSRNKKRFTLPVTPFVKKILTARYGSPVDVNQKYHREICTLLQLNPIINVGKKKKMLTTTVDFLIPYNLANAVQKTDAHALGISLHSSYLYRMYEFIYMHQEIAESVTAYHALQVFFDKFHLTDDDLDFDSAYRGWVRYKKHQKPTFTIIDLAEEAESVQPDFFFNVQRKMVQLQSLFGYTKINYGHFKKVLLNSPYVHLPEYSQPTINKVSFYLLKNLLGLSYQQIADRVGGKRSTIIYHVRTAEEHLQTNQEAAQLFSDIIKGLKKLCLPVLH